MRVVHRFTRHSDFVYLVTDGGCYFPGSMTTLFASWILLLRNFIDAAFKLFDGVEISVLSKKKNRTEEKFKELSYSCRKFCFPENGGNGEKFFVVGGGRDIIEKNMKA